MLLLIPVSFAADDSYKPYLHKPNVPEHPKVKLYGKYSTELFPGAGTYTYGIEVPKGTNSLQPSLTISYNSQSMKQRPSFLGAGWSLTQNYIFRDVNFTPSNTTDDEFKLILNGASYDLIFDNNDNFYHTETETFARIQNITNNSNTYNQYWLMTLKDGTQLRFGYNPDSELTSNTGYNYALKWSLDLIEDTHNNKIFYSYLENPYPQDNGSVYLSTITYNNEQKRKIEFNYENFNRPDRRKAFEQGNVLEETRRLTDISILFNNSLVRRHHFDFTNLNDEKSLSSLKNISYIGSDNASILHTINFNYYGANSFYTNSTVYNVSTVFQDAAGIDFGLRLADLNNDGFIDIIQGRQSTSEKNTWINNKTGWSQSSLFVLPEYFVDSSDNDKGLRIEDLNTDGFPDLIQGWGGVWKAWLNNETGFGNEVAAWAPSVDFVTAAGVDEGTQLVDFNGDGKVDILQAKENGAVKKAYLNTGSGWKDVSSLWTSPIYFSRNDLTGSDFGARLVDVNADGLIDILQGYNFGTQTRNAYLNNGTGWVQNDQFVPPDDFTTSSRLDNGIRLIDLNGDGLVDIFQDYANGTTTDRDAWLNNGTGWKVSTAWNSPEPFTSSGKNIGRRIGDVNGDGFGDIIIGYDTLKYTLIRNQTFPYLLKNITNEFGGLTYLYYSPSTIFNNSGEDGLSDIGFNVWVIKTALADNGLNNNFSVKANTSYNYFGGLYSYNDSEFRGFNIVNETLPDNTTITHYFHQNKELKGKEFKTETFDKNANLFLKTENTYNITNKNNNSIFAVQLKSASTYLYDGNNENPKTTNISYKYDNYSNVISKTSFGDISINGDEKYENYTFVYNNSVWIMDKVSKYQLFDSNSNKLRETKYFYDNKLVGLTKGDLTKQEEWLDDETGNPVTYYNYDEFGNPYRQTDPLGRTIIYYYGSKDSTNTYPDRRVNELGHAVDYEYDVATGNILSTTKHGVVFSNAYDVFGRIKKEIQPYDTSTFPTKEYTYDFDGIAPEIMKVSQKTTSNNTIDTYYYYDGFANLVQIKSPTDEEVQTQTSTQKKAAMICLTAACSNARQDVPYKNNLTALGYQVTTIIHTNNSWDTSKYDVIVISASITSSNVAWIGNTTATGVITMEGFNYDEFGLGTGGSDTTANDDTVNITNVLHTITSGFSVGQINATYHTTNQGHMLGWGNDVKALAVYASSPARAKILAVDKGEILAGGNTAGGRRAAFLQTNGSDLNQNGIILWQNALDWAASQQASIDAEAQVVKNIFYDGLFRVKEEQNPYFSTFTTTISNVSNSANTTKYNYDALSRITSVINPDGTKKNTTYNKNTIKDYDENSNFKTYYLDAYDRIIGVEEHNTDFYIKDNETYNTTYSYNGADELVGIRDNEGNNFNFTYNSLGQKIQLDDPDLGTWKYGYDFAGNLIRQTDNKGNQIVMGYDGLNRIDHKNTSSTKYNFTYDEQYQGTLSKIEFDNITYSYVYDDRLRPIKETRISLKKDWNQTMEKEFAYDSMDRIRQIIEPNGKDIDLYYSHQNRINKIKGWINQSNYNAFSNPLNRTYNIAKTAQFDYYSDNARLKQIKTDTIQILNYSYDNVGNVKQINDQNNSRLYSMSYDNLDRLTNVSIGTYKWVYSYNAIGNVLKIVRNFSTTTNFKFDGSIAHAPQKYIVTNTSVDVHRYSNFNGSNKTKVFEFYLINEKNKSVEYLNWTAEFGDNSKITSNQPFNLSLGDNILVIVEHNYTKGGDYRINLTGGINASLSDYETLKLLFGAKANDLTVIKKNGTLIVTQFSAENTINKLSQNWAWNCSNGVFSTISFNMSSNQGLLVVMEHNYSLSSLSLNLTCKVNSTDGNQSITLPFSFNNIAIESYNSTLKGDSGIEVQFQIKNYFNNLNVEWNITAANQVIKSSAPITLTQGQTTSITQEINFTTRGVKPLKITVYSGNFTDTYSENVRLYSLDILNFLNIAKNGTTRVFNFVIQNTWTTLTAYWNVSDPIVQNTVNLTSNESLIVVIEENYGQGKKNVEVRLYNQTILEDKVTEVFTIKHIGINQFETLHQNNSWVITSALVTNNINPLNLSWLLDNSQYNITSTLNLELNTSQQAFIVIENNFSESGIYPLNFLINSSTKNDNATGVAIS